MRQGIDVHVPDIYSDKRLHRILYRKCIDVSWRFLLRPFAVTITKTTS